jgi:hypothetical protein
MNPTWIDSREALAPASTWVQRKQECGQLNQEHEAWFEDQRQRVKSALATRRDSESRKYLLLATSLDVTGPVRDAVGVESMVSGIVHRTGRHTTLSPKVGLETEPIANYLKVRAGTYLEPPRFDDAPLRIHATVGLDLHLFDTAFGGDQSSWRLGAAVDRATQFFSWGLSAGIWH